LAEIEYIANRLSIIMLPLHTKIQSRNPNKYLEDQKHVVLLHVHKVHVCIFPVCSHGEFSPSWTWI